MSIFKKVLQESPSWYWPNLVCNVQNPVKEWGVYTSKDHWNYPQIPPQWNAIHGLTDDNNLEQVFLLLNSAEIDSTLEFTAV